MRKILTILFGLALGTGVSAQPGALDLSFGNEGIVVTDFDMLPQYGRALLLQPDGKIILAGFAQLDDSGCPDDFDFALVRYHPDGTLDTSFGNGGLAGNNYGIQGEGCPGDDFGFSAAFEFNGSILVTGTSQQGPYTDWILARFLNDGTPDENVGELGRIPVPYQGVDPTPGAIISTFGGDYIIAGGAFNGNDRDIALTRLHHENLSADLLFGDNGIVTTDLGESDETAIAVAQHAGKLIVTGYSDDRVIVARYDYFGSLDPTFGNGGIVTTDILGLEEKGLDLAVQSDGKIVVTGYLSRPVTCVGFECDHEMVVLRYLPDGTLDPSFGEEVPQEEQAGVVWVPGTEANALAIQPDGKILIGGKVDIPGFGGPRSAFALARFHTDGTLDTSFHNGTYPIIQSTPVVTDINEGGVDIIYDLLIQPDGKILAAGQSGDNFAVVRYLSGLSTSTQTAPLPAMQARLYPNPVHDEAVLEYVLEKTEAVTIQLLDLNGRVLHTFAEGEIRAPGRRQERLRFPAAMPSGLFVVSIRAGKGTSFLKVVCNG